MGMQIDDAHFRNLLLETQVLNTKDHTKWAFDILLELLEGPLRNPKRLDEAMRASKFLRRLLSFFHPFSYRYAEVKKDKVRP
jgi:rapamycin-insensitive companion of mTOR